MGESRGPRELVAELPRGARPGPPRRQEPDVEGVLRELRVREQRREDVLEVRVLARSVLMYGSARPNSLATSGDRTAKSKAVANARSPDAGLIRNTDRAPGGEGGSNDSLGSPSIGPKVAGSRANSSRPWKLSFRYQSLTPRLRERASNLGSCELELLVVRAWRVERHASW